MFLKIFRYFYVWKQSKDTDQIIGLCDENKYCFNFKLKIRSPEDQSSSVVLQHLRLYKRDPRHGGLEDVIVSEIFDRIK